MSCLEIQRRSPNHQLQTQQSKTTVEPCVPCPFGPFAQMHWLFKADPETLFLRSVLVHVPNKQTKQAGGARTMVYYSGAHVRCAGLFLQGTPHRMSPISHVRVLVKMMDWFSTAHFLRPSSNDFNPASIFGLVYLLSQRIPNFDERTILLPFW